MATAKMKKFKLIISRTDLANVLCELMLLGCIEINDSAMLLEDPHMAVLMKRESSELESCMQDFESLERSLNIIDMYSPDEAADYTQRPVITLDKLLYETYPESCLMLAKSLETLDGMMLMLPENEKAELLQQIQASAQRRDEIKLCCDHFRVRVLMAETVEKLIGTQRTVLMTGWVPAKAELELMLKMTGYVCAWDFSDPSPDEYESVPVMQKGSRLLSKFQKESGVPFRPLMLFTKYVDVR